MKPTSTSRLCATTFGLLLGALPPCGAQTPAPTPVPVKTLTPPAKLLLLTNTAERAHATDAKLKPYFESLGFIVTMVEQSDGAAQKLEGYELIFISPTTSSEKMPHAQAERYRHTKVPIVNCEAALLGRLGMTGLRPAADWGAATAGKDAVVAVINQTHPMQAEIPNGPFSPFKGPVREINWGKPGVGAIKIAMIPGHREQFAVFGYDKGAVMDYQFVAPARRIMVCLPDGGFDQLTEGGRHMLNGALTWALSRKPLAR